MVMQCNGSIGMRGALLLWLALVLLLPSTEAFAPVVPSTTRLSTSRLSALSIDTVGSVIESFYQTEPYTAAFVTCSVKATAADWVAQQQQDESTEVDLARTGAFFLYGGLYQGLVQQFIFAHVFPALFGTDHSWTSVASQVLTDMALIGPLVCLPIAYLTKAWLMDSSNIESAADVWQIARQKYTHDVIHKSLLFHYWTLWFPAQVVTFGVIPTHFRVAFVAAVSFVWVIILSATSAEDQPPAPQLAWHEDVLQRIANLSAAKEPRTASIKLSS